MRALVVCSLLLMGFTAGGHTPAPEAESEYGFQFVRIKYESYRGWTWAFDYPTAEENLNIAIERTTVLHVDGAPLVLTLEDEAIFDHPILYLCEPGYWITNDEEIAALQEYFARGGFMIIDDFHDYGDGRVGPEWNNFYNIIKQVFPDREPVELTRDHPIWSIYYDIDPDAAISTKNGGRRRFGGMRFGPLDDIYYGIFDDTGRMMVVICYNQDIGDGWEWPGGRNLGEASTVSFQMAINFIIWALTH